MLYQDWADLLLEKVNPPLLRKGGRKDRQGGEKEHEAIHDRRFFPARVNSTSSQGQVATEGVRPFDNMVAAFVLHIRVTSVGRGEILVHAILSFKLNAFGLATQAFHGRGSGRPC